MVYAIADLLEECWDMLVFEGETTAQHDVQDHAARPDVDLRACVEFAGYHFWCRVVGASARCAQEVAIGDFVAQTCVQEGA